MNEPNIYEIGEKISDMIQKEYGGMDLFTVLTAMRLAILRLEIRSDLEQRAEFLAHFEKLPPCFRGSIAEAGVSSCEAPR